MTQHDYNIANQPMPNARTDINNALVALASMNSGSTAPTTTIAGMLWADTATGLLKQRNQANTAWHIKGRLEQHGWDRTNSGAPSSVTPDFAGQILYDSTNGDLYFAHGTTSGSWQEIAKLSDIASLVSTANANLVSATSLITADMPSGNDPKILHRISSTRTRVISKNPAFKGRYVAIDLIYGSGEEGKTDFEFWRHEKVYDGRSIWVYKSLTGATTSGTWEASFVYNYWTMTGTGANAQEYPITGQRSLTQNSYIEQTVYCEDGYINLLFLGTSGSCQNAEVYVDGALLGNINLDQDTNPNITANDNFIHYRRYVGRGSKVVRVKHASATGGYIYICSMNAVKPEDVVKYGDYNSICYYRTGDYYMTSTGANDVAISIGGAFVGSFHGSEIANTPAKWYLDGVETTLADGNIISALNIDVVQSTTIAGVITSNSITSFNGNGRLEKLISLSGTATIAALFLGMVCARATFNEIIYPVRLTGLSGNDSSDGSDWTGLGFPSLIIQRNPITNQKVYSSLPLWTGASPINPGIELRKASSSDYMKLYSSYNKGASVSSVNITGRIVNVFG